MAVVEPTRQSAAHGGAHKAGDERLRETDTLARLGGDEFAILLPEASAEQANELGLALAETVRLRAVAGAGETTRRTTASVGVAVYEPTSKRSGEHLLSEADMAMYDAKDQGGDRCVLHRVDASGSERLSIETIAWPDRLRRALDEDRLVLYAQPILDLHADTINHYELLLRLVGDDGELIAPGAFLPVAERRGMILAIDRWVVRNAIKLLRERRARGTACRLQINLSGRSFADPDLLRYIEDQLDAENADPSDIVSRSPRPMKAP